MQITRLFSKIIFGLKMIKPLGIKQLLIKVLKRMGHKENYLFFVCSPNQSDEGVVNESIKKGYSLLTINNQSSDAIINNIANFFNNEYFLKQYPVNSTENARQRFVRDRLNDGEVCFAIKHEDKIVHMSWLGFDKTSKYNETGKPILKHNYEKVGLSYNTYCDSLHRGNSLQLVCTHYKFKYMKSKNYCQMIAFIGANNSASIKNMASLGRYKGLLIVRNYILFEKREFIPIKFPKLI